MTLPTVTYQHDQDPRYGWANISLEDRDEILVIVHDESGSHGFIYRDGTMTPTCLCNAWSEDECGCGNYGKDTSP